MGIINIHVDELFVSPMNYAEYSVGQATICNNTGSQRNVKFNDLTGDFIVGKDFTNSAGFPAQTLSILNFTDVSVVIQNSTGNQTPTPGFVPNQMKNLVTNTVINTFPYNIAISNLSQLGQQINTLELTCPADMVNNTARRTREITYRIIDSNGNLGPVKTTQFYNTPDIS